MPAPPGGRSPQTGLLLRLLGPYPELGEREIASLLPLRRRLSQPRGFLLRQPTFQIRRFERRRRGANLLASLLGILDRALPRLELRSLRRDRPGSLLLSRELQRVVAGAEPLNLFLGGSYPLFVQLGTKTLQILLRRLGLVRRAFSLGELSLGLLEVALDRRIRDVDRRDVLSVALISLVKFLQPASGAERRIIR